MEGNPNNKQVPDLGEGIKPEDVVYSSRDILGSSIAGSDKKFFARVKKERQAPLKKYSAKDAKEKLATKFSKLKPILTNKKLWIITISVLAAVALVLGIVTFIIHQKDTADVDSKDATSEDINTEENSGEDMSSDDDSEEGEYNPIIEDIPDDIKNSDPGDLESSELSQEVWLNRKLNYIQNLGASEFFVTAGYEFESLIQDIEDYPDKYSDCQKADIYDAIGRLYQRRGDSTDGEAYKSNLELAGKYRNLCNGSGN